jgi:hypothetical protein
VLVTVKGAVPVDTWDVNVEALTLPDTFTAAELTKPLNPALTPDKNPVNVPPVLGRKFFPSEVTNAVVAICMELSPSVAVGAVGAPARLSEEARFALVTIESFK